MIRIALCDDEQQILDTVSLQIKKYAESRQDDIMETVCFRSANALLSALKDQKAFDIFVLDVYIGDAIGTGLANPSAKRASKTPSFS